MNYNLRSCSILNYGAGNISSVVKFFDALPQITPSVIDTSLSKIHSTDILVIPGVGSFGFGSSQITQNPYLLDSIINHYSDNKLIIGICLGAQLLLESSEESPGSDGLALLKGTSKSLTSLTTYSGKIPRVGWNTVKYSDKKDHFYFVHSFHLCPANAQRILKTSDGIVAAYNSDNVWGLQFHPEKSSLSGFSFLNYILANHV